MKNNTASGRINEAQIYLENGLIDSPKGYLHFLQTGELLPLRKSWLRRLLAAIGLASLAACSGQLYVRCDNPSAADANRVCTAFCGNSNVVAEAYGCVALPADAQSGIACDCANGNYVVQQAEGK